MTFPFSEQSLVRDIVNELPKSSDIFKRNRIDFCCGGNTPLLTAAKANGLNVESLLAEVKDLYEKKESNEENDLERWMNADSKAIIDHVIEKYLPWKKLFHFFIPSPTREEKRPFPPWSNNQGKIELHFSYQV